MATTNYAMANELAKANPELHLNLQKLMLASSKFMKALEKSTKPDIFGSRKRKLEAVKDEFYERLYLTSNSLESGPLTMNMPPQELEAVLSALETAIMVMERIYPNWQEEYRFLRLVLDDFK